MTFIMPSLRVHRATDDLAREVVGRALRAGGVVLGLAIVGVGILISPLPGPGGIPVIVIGLMVLLRNSFKAKRQFVKLQRKNPQMFFPIRRLLRREPEVLLVTWQQTLRVERLILPKRFRFLVALRKRRRK